ncbi:DUF7210 family protein [Aggregatibacter actinomycetemcomitans]|uniref:DUF7210 family protein n=1 Tax=Aggregatibacter actinomycetemcomitans TaxID=714 RepID=UPI000D68CECB|nr:hypothetical protein [Aggregatibacter actinomycetemcomitans]TYB11824.1 hypothetical protein FXB84_04210 [Aggregatibacter actinomycetemcomitans]
MADVKVILTAAHTHAGKQYQAGEVLELDQSSAQFIVRVGAGKSVDVARKDKETQNNEDTNNDQQ